MQLSTEFNFIEWLLDAHVFTKEDEGATYLELPLVKAGLANDYTSFSRLPDVAAKAEQLQISHADILRLAGEAYDSIRQTG